MSKLPDRDHQGIDLRAPASAPGAGRFRSTYSPLPLDGAVLPLDGAVADAKNTVGGAKPSKKAHRVEQAATVTVTLHFIGQFVNPWANNPALEKQRATPDPVTKKNKWHPGAIDFAATAGRSGVAVNVAGFRGFLGEIEKQQPGSIERINVFSHGGDGLIAFSGSVNVENGQVMLDLGTGLDEKTITDLEPIPKGQGKYEETLGAVAHRLRNRFANNAKICFYVCNSSSGIGLPLLQEIANAFQVVANGFSEEVGYAIQFDLKPPNAPIERGFTYRFRDGWEARKSGFGHLDQFFVTARPKAGKD